MLPPSKNISTATVGIVIVLVIGIEVKQGHVIAVMVAIVAAMVVIVAAMVVIIVAMVVIVAAMVVIVAAMVVMAIAIFGIIIIVSYSWLKGRGVIARWEVVMVVIEVWPWSVEFFLVIVAVQSWCVFIVGPQG